MKIEIVKPNKKIDWKQLEIEAGVTLSGIRTKGDKMWFENMSQGDVDKIEIALQTHVPTPKVLSSAEDKLNRIQDILGS